MNPGKESREDLLTLITTHGILGVQLELASKVPGVFAYALIKHEEADEMYDIVTAQYIADAITVASYLSMKEASYQFMNKLKPSLN